MTRPNLNAVTRVTEDFDGSICSTGFHVLRSAGADAGFLFAVVRSRAFVSSMTATVQGALYPAIRPDDVRAFTIDLPPLAEQRRIAAKLGNASRCHVVTAASPA
jgi:type I restriction enzyme S subunit